MRAGERWVSRGGLELARGGVWLARAGVWLSRGRLWLSGAGVWLSCGRRWLPPVRLSLVAAAVVAVVGLGCSAPPVRPTDASDAPTLTPEHAVALIAGPADAGRDTLELKVGVRNTSAAPLLTQGPQPGYVYQPDQTYLLPELAPTGDVWRVAVGPAGQRPDDLPYRWGLGGTLAPGATTTVTGRVRLPPGLASTPLVADLVHEPTRLAHFGVRWGLIAATAELQATVVVDTAEVRSLPSSQASVVAQVGYGSRLPVTSRTPDWLAVSLPDGRRGWVAADWIVLQAK